jgi:predicted TIM-barrel fold metal-dependent hydrolase
MINGGTIGRRAVVAGLAALSAGWGGETTMAKTAASLIDVHYHIAPPPWADLLTARHIMQPAWNGWSVEKAVEDMDRDGVALSMVSITTPGVYFGDAAAARTLSRQCNEFAAKMRDDHKGRFGIFAAVPMPDIDGTLAEIAYALDTLKADGIGFLTSYGNKWLGDPAFTPVMAELDRRKALAYTHPTVADCCRNLIPGIAPPVIEYGTDTTRAIGQLVFGGEAQRHPGIDWIFSHAGGTMPFLYHRFAGRAKEPGAAPGAMEQLRRFYYDTAQASTAPPLAALRQVAPVSHILFGTDYPYGTAGDTARELRQSRMFSAREMEAVGHGNAKALLGGTRA